ncbi:MAG TPA: DNA polymerase, partial [Flavobacterium sp.]
ETIEANAEKGLMSKKLATIICDCDVKFNEADYELTRPDSEKVEALFNELEFRRMAEQFNNLFYRKQEYAEIETTSGLVPTKTIVKSDQFDLFSNEGDNSQAQIRHGDFRTIDNTPHHYQMVKGEMATKLLMQNLLKQSSISMDIETTSIDAIYAELVGLSFTWEKGKGFYVPLPEIRDDAQMILEKFRPFYESESIEKVGHNLKYDLKVLANYGVQVKGKLFDTMIAHYLINPDMRHTIDVLSETYLGYSITPMEALVGKKGKGQLTLREAAEELVTNFAVEDTDVTWQLKEVFSAMLEETDTKKLFDDIEIPLVSVLGEMELEGVRLDVDFLKSLSADLTNDIKILEDKIYESAGEKFNIGSPKQLGEILFDKLKIGGVKQKKTKTGQYATGEDILSFLALTSPFVQDILDWRQLVKLQNTYVEALPQQVCQRTGRVHTDYMQAVAATGRLSSNNPNLQNIPIRTERGRQIRKAFIPKDENHTLLSADYSQIELRIIAALSGEEIMIESFRNGEDIHKSTAARVFNVPLEEVTRDQRSHAKTVNFGIVYGVSAFGLSNQTSLSRGESKDLIEAYYKTYPRLKAYIQEQVQTAREIGYAQTISGRRRYLKDINSQNAIVRGAAERNAVNA